jgi:hypothetical protein
MERAIAESGRAMKEMTVDEMEREWERVKLRATKARRHEES